MSWRIHSQVGTEIEVPKVAKENVCAGRYCLSVAAFLVTMLLQGDYETVEAADLWSLVYVKILFLM